MSPGATAGSESNQVSASSGRAPSACSSSQPSGVAAARSAKDQHLPLGGQPVHPGLDLPMHPVVDLPHVGLVVHAAGIVVDLDRVEELGAILAGRGTCAGSTSIAIGNGNPA